ncbi:MAG: serine/threonine-protein kinase [Planctomycetota bacterium]
MDWETFYNRFRQKDFIPGYEILVRLGGGAFGDVYKARKASIGKSYAIKFLKLEEGSKAIIERELAHVGRFASIDHPNLVTIEDMGVVLGVPYLIMGYAGDQTLAKRIKAGPLPLEETLSLFHQIARGVERLHKDQLVHFDLKPGNIFLQGNRARVGDYGLAKFFEQGGQSLSMGRGTPHYMAPEILLGRGDMRSDIYSYGVMLYECLTGRKPFGDPSDPMAIRQPDDPPPAMSSLPEPIRKVLLGCLAWNPDDRFESMGAVRLALPRPLASGPVIESDPSDERTAAVHPLVAARAARRPDWLRLVLFALVFAMIGFLVSLGGMALVRALMEPV